MKKQWIYIHTIHDIVGTYLKGEQIVYAHGHRGSDGILNVCSSIAQIKKEQRLSIKWRKSKGFGVEDNKYGYVRILKNCLTNIK